MNLKFLVISFNNFNRLILLYGFHSSEVCKLSVVYNLFRRSMIYNGRERLKPFGNGNDNNSRFPRRKSLAVIDRAASTALG